MKNPFLKIALTQAVRFTGKPGRMLRLVAQMVHRLYRMDRTHLTAKLRLHLLTLGRLVTSYARGHYRSIPLKAFFTIIAALLYFLNPLDLIPDAILGVGLIDDLAVITWVYRTTQEELNKFVQWEKTVATAIG